MIVDQTLVRIGEGVELHHHRGERGERWRRPIGSPTPGRSRPG
jgi:hypothetical protein